ncbi:MAG TPA: YndJ family transporter [Kofleriaceae bacterium]|jgi:hypothetical protein
MSELDLLRVLLLLSMVIGPLGTRRLFDAPAWHRAAHVGALLCATVGMFLVPIMSVGWLLFTATNFGLFLWSRRASLVSPTTIATAVPFLFSNIAAVWVVGGSNGLHLLGYGADFSYYAALHGNVLGWIVLGALAILADQLGPQRRIYLGSMFVCLGSFLLIAFGIDQLRALKPFGVIGLSVALAGCQLVFLRSVWSRNRRAFLAGCVSFACLVLTMALAWRNEFVTPIFQGIAGIRGMVSVHGLLNAVVAGPSFLLAVSLDTQPRGPRGV